MKESEPEQFKQIADQLDILNGEIAALKLRLQSQGEASWQIEHVMNKLTEARLWLNDYINENTQNYQVSDEDDEDDTPEEGNDSGLGGRN
jgi:hypothetical protein